MQVTMIGVGRLLELMWPVFEPTLGGPDVGQRVIGVTADAADLDRKRATLPFEVLLDDNLGALQRNRPDIIMFAPPPTVAEALINSVLRPYFEQRRSEGAELPEIYAYPPMPLGAVYLEALGDDVRVVNIIPNNVTSIGGREVVDEGHYVCTFARPWPTDRVGTLQQLFAGQGAFVQLEPHQIVSMLGGACSISILWHVVPELADRLTAHGPPISHHEVGEYLRGQLRAHTGFTPVQSTPVRGDWAPAHHTLLDALAEAWHTGVTRYFAETDLAPDAASVLIERGFDLMLHTTQVEERSTLDDLAIGAATKGGVLERGIRAARDELLPDLDQRIAGNAGPWGEFADLVAALAHTVREHGMTLAG